MSEKGRIRRKWTLCVPFSFRLIPLALSIKFAILSPAFAEEHSFSPQTSDATTSSTTQTATDKLTAVLESLKKELERSMAKLRNQGSAPVYYLAYRVLESDSVDLYGKYGSIDSLVEPERFRSVQVELRVGDPSFDNTHKHQDEYTRSYVESASIPLDDDDVSIRMALWRATDRAFKKAQKQYAYMKARRDLKVKELDDSADFCMEGKQSFSDELSSFKVDRTAWEDRVRRLSGVFNDYPFIHESSVRFTAGREIRYLVTSEGTAIRDFIKSYIINLYAETTAEDGMELFLSERIEAFGDDTLPSEDEVRSRILKMADRLSVLREAPVAEPYAGPAILQGRAAGVFFHEILGHRLEGHRQKDESEARTFRSKIDVRIMPEFITVVDDPSIRRLDNTELSGFYRFDDEGVPSKPVVLVDKGVLKNFLMARSPIKGFSKSNGHGRCDYSNAPVARQGNLMVLADKSKQVSYERLRQMLIEEAKRQGKEFGLIFADIAGGSTLTHIGEPQLFELYPLVVTRVYTDGRPDEIIRGVDIVGTPLASLEHIIASADDMETFNGVCGAESGWVPVSASSTSLLLKTLEVQRKPKEDEKPPLLPAPFTEKSKEKGTTGSQADSKNKTSDTNSKKD
ncbi:MAG: peptidase U62 [Cyanobacteria bacterium]|nr:peptidase U62 [Cyanobacteriota bacterium]